jgi:hypothetical protein
VPDIGPLHIDDSIIAAQPLVKLTMTHVKGNHLACTALQKTVGKSACRSPCVKSPKTGYI